MSEHLPERRADKSPFDYAILEWVDALRSAGRPPTTIRTRTQHIRQLAQAFPGRSPWSLTTADLITWCAAHDWRPETRHSVRSSLRGFYGWGCRAGLISDDPAASLPAVHRAPPRPHPVPDEVLERVLAEAPPRERLMIKLAAWCGLRRAEVAQLHTRDVLRDGAGWSLLVRGKGGRARVVPLPNSLAAELLEREPGWVFPGTQGRHLDAQHLGNTIKALLPPGWSMHSLRHRFATRAYSVDRDLLTVQQLLGHSSPTTTQRYVLVPGESLRSTVEAVSSAR